MGHMNDKSINNGESIANMKHNNAVLEKHIFNDNLGLDEVIDLDFDKNLDKRTIRPPKERTKTSLTSLPSENLIQSRSFLDEQNQYKNLQIHTETAFPRSLLI